MAANRELTDPNLIGAGQRLQESPAAGVRAALRSARAGNADAGFAPLSAGTRAAAAVLTIAGLVLGTGTLAVATGVGGLTVGAAIVLFAAVAGARLGASVLWHPVADVPGPHRFGRVRRVLAGVGGAARLVVALGARLLDTRRQAWVKRRTRTAQQPADGVRAALRHRPFAVLLVALTVSNVGGFMQQVVADWLPLRLPGGSVTLLGAIVAVQAGVKVLGLLLQFVGVGRNWGLRRQLIWSTWGLVASSATFAGLGLAGALSIPSIFALTAVASLFQSFTDGAQSPVIARVAMQRHAAASRSLVNVGKTLARSIGPLAGAGLLAARASIWPGGLIGGAGWVYLANVVSFAGVLLVLLRSKITEPQGVGTGDSTTLTAYHRYLRQHPTTLWTLVLNFVGLAFGATFFVTLPVVVAVRFHLGALALGQLQLAVAAGNALGGLIAARRPTAGWTVIGALGLGLANLALAVVPGFWSFFGLLTVAGITLGVFSQSASNLLYRDAPKRFDKHLTVSRELTTDVGNLVDGPLIPALVALGALAPFLYGGVITTLTAGVLGPALLLGGFAAATSALAALSRRFAPALPRAPPPLRRVVGLIVVGGVLVVFLVLVPGSSASAALLAGGISAASSPLLRLTSALAGLGLALGGAALGVHRAGGLAVLRLLGRLWTTPPMRVLATRVLAVAGMVADSAMLLGFSSGGPVLAAGAAGAVAAALWLRRLFGGMAAARFRAEVGAKGTRLRDAGTALVDAARVGGKAHEGYAERLRWAAWLVGELEQSGQFAGQDMPKLVARALQINAEEVRERVLTDPRTTAPDFSFFAEEGLELLNRVTAETERRRLGAQRADAAFDVARLAVRNLIGAEIDRAVAAGVSDRRIARVLGLPRGVVAMVTDRSRPAPGTYDPGAPSKGLHAGASERDVWLELAAASAAFAERRQWVAWAFDQLNGLRDDAWIVARLPGALGLSEVEVRSRVLNLAAPPRGPPGLAGRRLGPDDLVAELGRVVAQRRDRLRLANDAAAALPRPAAGAEPAGAPPLVTDGFVLPTLAALRSAGLKVTGRGNRVRLSVPGGMTVDPRLGEAVNKLGKFADGHLHHSGYPYHRVTSLGGLVESLLAAGHDVVLTFHPIPQRIKGMAYYGDVDAQTGTTRFGVTMLAMRGKLTDAQMFRAVRNLPAHLGWRVIAGITGARFDIPGLRRYLQAMVVLHPELAFFLGEMTFAKENVKLQLGPQAANLLDPEYTPTLERLREAVARLRAAFEDGRLDRAACPRLAAIVDDLYTGLADQVALRLVHGLHQLADPNIADAATMVQLRDALRAIGVLEAGEELGRFRIGQVYGSGLIEYFEFLSETGATGVTHNDAGEPLLGADGYPIAAPPDMRYLMAFLAAKKDFPKARVIYAHLGAGKFSLLSEAYLNFLDKEVMAKRDERFPNLYFDVSWNDLAQHIERSPAIQEKFIQLGVNHHTMLVFGTDGVKPANVPHYLRHHYDMHPLLAEIERRAKGAKDRIRYRNLIELLAASRADVRAWALANIESGLWDEVLSRFPQADQQRVRDWATLQRYYGQDTTQSSRISAVDPAQAAAVDPGAEPFTDNQQLADMLGWHHAVSDRSARGRQTWRLWWHGLKVTMRELRRGPGSPGHGMARPARPARVPADVPAAPYTIEALIAADQAGRVGTSPDHRNRTMELVQQRQSDNNAAREAIADKTAKQWRVFRLLLWAAGVLTVSVVASLILGAPELLPWINAVAFVARGLLTLLRVVEQNLVRAVHESMGERGQVTEEKVAFLYRKARRNAHAYGIDKGRLAEFESVTHQFLVNMFNPDPDDPGLMLKPLQPGESLEDRHSRIIAEYSRWYDQANRALGPSLTSLLSTAPQGRWGRWISAAIVTTFWGNLAYHIYATGTALLAGQWGLEVLTNRLYAVTDVIFLVLFVPPALSGWLRFNVASWPWARKLTNYWAFPLVTVANLALTALFVTQNLPGAAVVSGLVVAAGVVVSIKVAASALLAGSTGYLSALGFQTELALGVRVSRRLPTATALFALSLVGLGLMATPRPLLADIPALAPLVVLAAVWALKSNAKLGYEHLRRGGRWITAVFSWRAARALLATVSALTQLTLLVMPGLGLAATVGVVAGAVPAVMAVITTAVVMFERARIARTDSHLRTVVNTSIGQGPNNGPLAGVPGYELTGPQKNEFEPELRTRMASGTRVSVDELPYGTRGPPLVLICRVPGYEAVIAYTIHLDGRAVIVMFADTYTEIRALQAQGLLDADYLERVLAFEHDFRVVGLGSDHERQARAKDLIDELNQARAARDRPMTARAQPVRTRLWTGAALGVVPVLAHGALPPGEGRRLATTLVGLAATWIAQRFGRAALRGPGAALVRLGHRVSAALLRPVGPGMLWLRRWLRGMGWAAIGALSGWAAAAWTGHGVIVSAAGLLVMWGPEMLALPLVVLPELRGRKPNDWVRVVASAWAELGVPRSLGLGVLIGAIWFLLS